MAYQFDSRKILPGDTFICMPGGDQFILDAKNRGAVDVIYKTREELAVFGNDLFNQPSEKLCVIGVTGTNGKTTVTHFVQQALRLAGYNAAIMGTINCDLTTPESFEIFRSMRKHLDDNGTHFVMEVSSHGIDQGRISGIDFDVKLLTNITQDHLGYHGTFENYKQTKLRFMSDWPGVSIGPEDYQKEKIPFPVTLPGQFNYLNLQAAVSILRALNIDEDIICQAFKTPNVPPGRFEFVDAGQSYYVIVDYAHTPDGLENVLKEAKRLAVERKGALLTVFGCGGDRDRSKRPRMATVACKYSDHVAITHDNPRTEDEVQIINDVVAGVPIGYTTYEVIPDRHAAILSVINKAESQDVVIIAGKGHETYQILKSGKIHFDDREEACNAIKLRR